MDIKALKQAAQAATPGPWTAKDAPGAGLEIYADVPSQLGMPAKEWPAFSTANADVKSNLIAYETWVQFPTEKLKNVQARNAVFIAAANPAAVLALIESHDQLVAALKEALATIDDYLSYEHNGDPWTEDARAMGEMDIDDYSRDGRLEKARAALAAATNKD